jgi:hypothetical protein
MGASDVPAASEERTAKNSKPQARATANEAALKWDITGQGACSRSVEDPPITILGRPVAFEGPTDAALNWSGVWCVWALHFILNR